MSDFNRRKDDDIQPWQRSFQRYEWRQEQIKREREIAERKRRERFCEAIFFFSGIAGLVEIAVLKFMGLLS